ncbi:urease accessory protein UreF [Hansschlegelia quercus]|uniref:Urease accessory protein UreF n=1 Tax=Hansschlegelia quercus TaxID=2528245 RepID=A0A4V2JED7_9HYPH|nr:urease accessory protein UreF [Hansschlegelia quercus]TBN54876.1 urease accessory protein UreF [Hansschlegelia quercus]
MGDGGAALLPLFAWLTPAFPVGGYAYSHGLEQAVEDGDVRDAASLEIWLGEALELGFARNDAILLITAHRAVLSDDLRTLGETNELALAFAPTRELNLETSQQGRSFLDATLAAWPNPRLALAAEALPGEVAYPIAVGVASAAHDIPAENAAAAFLLAISQALVSAGVRLAPVGQTSGAKIVARLAPLVSRLAAGAMAATIDDLASATFRLDLGSARHETQYTRLFRS